MQTKTNGAALLAALLLTGVTAIAATTPEDKCEASKTRETGKLASCLMTSLSKSAATGADPDQDALDSCTAKFTAKIGAAEDKAAGACPTTGDAAALADSASAFAGSVKDTLGGVRFLDNGDGTVTDTEQGIVWQKQVAGGDAPSGIDQLHTAADMLAHLGALNGSSAVEGLGGRNDWGLPTLAQMQSILDCSSPPCVFRSPLLGPNPTPASVGSTYMMTGETGTLPMSTLPCIKLIVMEDGSVECKDLPSTEGRSKVRTNNNAR